MSTQDVIFLVLAVIAGVSALYAVLSRYLLRTIIGFGSFLTAVAGEFYLLAGDFVAFIQLFVYVGGVVVLMLFAMMLSASGRRSVSPPPVYRPLGVVVAYTLGGGLVWASWSASLPRVPPQPEETARLLGDVFLHQHIYSFELVGAILLAALVAALTIVRGERK